MFEKIPEDRAELCLIHGKLLRDCHADGNIDTGFPRLIDILVDHRIYRVILAPGTERIRREHLTVLCNVRLQLLRLPAVLIVVDHIQVLAEIMSRLSDALDVTA